MYDWNDLRYFLELSRQGKLVRAAARLHVDHTTVSRRIAALEKELDVRLFDKSPRGYQLTDAGLRLLPLAEQLMRETQEAGWMDAALDECLSLCRRRAEVLQPEQAYLDIISDLDQQGAQAVILGCTEIGMLIKPTDTPVPLYDTTDLHANAAVTYALK